MVRLRARALLIVALAGLVPIVLSSPAEAATCFSQSGGEGTSGDNNFTGDDGVDVWSGLGGDDAAHGLGGEDKLCGDADDDGRPSVAPGEFEGGRATTATFQSQMKAY